jgi:hypothetical protein
MGLRRADLILYRPSSAHESLRGENFYLDHLCPASDKLSKVLPMSVDAKKILANLVEQERIKGHHSAEGRAIRTLARALSGWSADNLSAADVLVLCDQAVEDWLKARLNRSPWSAEPIDGLLRAATSQHLITPAEMMSLQELRALRQNPSRVVPAPALEAALEFCIQLLEKHW